MVKGAVVDYPLVGYGAGYGFLVPRPYGGWSGLSSEVKLALLDAPDEGVPLFAVEEQGAFGAVLAVADSNAFGLDCHLDANPLAEIPSRVAGSLKVPSLHGKTLASVILHLHLSKELIFHFYPIPYSKFVKCLLVYIIAEDI
jgi:hypothetical protein